RGHALRGWGRRAAPGAELVAAARPVHPVLGGAVRAHRRPHARGGARRPGRGRRARRGVRVAPAADRGAAAVPGGPAAVARPAPAAVRPGQPDLDRVRRRRGARHPVRRTGRPPGRARPRGGPGEGGVMTSGSPTPHRTRARLDRPAAAVIAAVAVVLLAGIGYAVLDRG